MQRIFDIKSWTFNKFLSKKELKNVTWFKLVNQYFSQYQ